MVAPLRTGPWKLTDLKDVPKNGLKVFSCFHCGGGSTMGYKLAGYEVVGGVEIDPKIMEVYRKNHNPKHSYLMGVEEFNKILDCELPDELFDLDILDGSPPCSSFSSAGSREKKWGKSSKFREGQVDQVLDDLFFHFIDTAKKLQPRIVIAENVKGLISGKARGYVKEIFAGFREAGYTCQLFLLNASRMGVPQRRERIFFIAVRNDIDLPKLAIEFSEPIIPFSVIKSVGGQELSGNVRQLWEYRRPSDLHIGMVNERLGGKVTGFTTKFIHENRPLYTIIASDMNILYHEPRLLNDQEIIAGQTFPIDYDFGNQAVRYLCGMSVPPFMIQRIADQIERQWLSKLVTVRRSKQLA